jgi:hypothetical protein
VSKPKRSLEERAAEADLHSQNWLAAGNDAYERGEYSIAESAYAKAQYWFDRLTAYQNQLDDRKD